MPEPAHADLVYAVRGCPDLAAWYLVASKTGAGAWAWLGGGAARIVPVLPAPPGRSLLDFGIPQAHQADPRGFLHLHVTLP